MPVQNPTPITPQPSQAPGQPINLPMDAQLASLPGMDEATPESMKDVGEGEPEYDHYENLVAKLDDKLLTTIGQKCFEGYEKDNRSRSEWMETIKKGLENLGTSIDESDEPFEGACSANHPLILEAAVKFQSKATAEVLPANGPVRTQVMGAQTPDKIAAADRVKAFLNYQIMNVMTEYVPDMERLLFYLPLYGSAFKKTYWNSQLGRPESCFISSDNFIINYKAKSIEKARRHTEVLEPIAGMELRRRYADGDYAEPRAWAKSNSQTSRGKGNEDVTGNSDVGGSGTFYIEDVSRTADRVVGQAYTGDFSDEKMFTLLEQHCYLKLPSDVFACPYVVTFEKDSSEVLAIRRNWRDGDISQKKRIWYSHYQYVPGLGFYGLGLFHLLGNFNVTLTAVIRSLVDSGQFANMQGGFKLKGMRIVGDNGALSPGEWKDVEGAVQDLSKAFFPLPYKEPSQVLFQMLQYLETRGQQFADSTEQVVADSTNYGPVGTTVALLEASMKLFNAIHKRVHFAQKVDLKILAEINFEYLDDEYPYDLPGQVGKVFKIDFDPKRIAIIPASDPNITSQAHRLNLANTVLQAALQAPPGTHNMKIVFRNFYMSCGVENIDTIITPDQQPQPMDPLGDIQSLMKGMPIQAFPGQDHMSHIKFKTTWLDDPVLGGQNPQMQAFVPQVQSNIRDHMTSQLSEQIQGITQGQQQSGPPDPKVIAAIQAQAAAEVQNANKALNAITQGDDPMHVIAAAEKQKADAETQKVQDSKVTDLMKLSLQAQDSQTNRLKVQSDLQDKQHKQGMDKARLGMEAMSKASDQQVSRVDAQTRRKQAMKPIGK